MATIHDYAQIDVWNLAIAQAKLGISASVPTTRRVDTDSPLVGGGDLSDDLTLSMPPASAAQSGYLSASNFARFMSKQAALTFAEPLLNTANTVSLPEATALVDGYLSATDWAAFDAKEEALAFTPPLTRTGDTIAWTGDTDDVPEGANLYYTVARFNTAFAAKSTSDLLEGTNLYYTNARADARIAAATIAQAQVTSLVSDLTAKVGRTGNINFFGATAQSQQAVAALTNNVTSGGTNDTIADFSDLTVFANSSGAIRDNLYQISRKLSQVVTALRTYGLLG